MARTTIRIASCSPSSSFTPPEKALLTWGFLVISRRLHRIVWREPTGHQQSLGQRPPGSHSALCRYNSAKVHGALGYWRLQTGRNELDFIVVSVHDTDISVAHHAVSLTLFGLMNSHSKYQLLHLVDLVEGNHPSRSSPAPSPVRLSP